MADRIIKQGSVMRHVDSNSNTQKQCLDLFCRIVNKELGVDTEREYQFHATRKWRFDYAIIEHKIAIEVEGGVWTQGRHTRPKGFLGDMDKYNAAAQNGWRVLRVTPDSLLSVKTLNMIKATIDAYIKGEKNLP